MIVARYLARCAVRWDLTGLLGRPSASSGQASRLLAMTMIEIHACPGLWPRRCSADCQISEACATGPVLPIARSEEHTSELQSLMRISYAVFCLKKKKNETTHETII